MKNATAPRGYSPGTFASHSWFRALSSHCYSAILQSGPCLISFTVFLCTKWSPSFTVNLLYPCMRFRQVSLNTSSKSMVTAIQTPTNCIWPCLCPLAHRWRPDGRGTFSIFLILGFVSFSQVIVSFPVLSHIF